MTTPYLIGQDATPSGGGTGSPLYNPANGSGGAFARTFSGVTPKYALNNGQRQDPQGKNTMARMFMQMSAAEQRQLINSVTDTNLKTNVLPALISNATSTTAVDTGYVDFFLQQVQSNLEEKVQVVETLSDNYVAYFFGQKAPIWTYSGNLINSVQDDQLANMVKLYISVLRGIQLARRSKVVSLRYDSFIVTGTILNLNWQHNVQNELIVPFGFSLLVKRLYVINTTTGWVPTAVNVIPPAQDPHLNQANSTANSSTQPQAAVVQGATAPATPARQATWADSPVLPAEDPSIYYGGGNGNTAVTNPSQNSSVASNDARAQAQVTGQAPEAQTVPNAPDPNASTRPQDNPQPTQSAPPDVSNTYVGTMRNGQAAPDSLQSMTY
jgi:hypothetical protein